MTTPAMAVPDHDASLIRAIGLGSATLFVIGSVVGSGIFLTTGIMAESIPSASLLLLAWTLGGLLALTGGLTYFVPALSPARVIVDVPLPFGAAWTLSAGQIVAVASISVLGAINYVGVRSGNMVNAVMTVAKVAGLAALPVMALLFPRVDPAFTPVVPPDLARPMASFGVAMIAVLWTYEAWYFVTYAAGEIENPQRTLPLALVFGILALMAIYLSVNVAYLYALRIDEMQGVVRIAQQAATALVGPGGATFVALTVLVSTFGCNAPAILGGSRLLFAMAGDGVFFRAAGVVHPFYRTPHAAIVGLTVWSSVLALAGT